jgi:penicillin-binding protein 1A
MSFRRHLHQWRKKLPLPKLETVFYTLLVLIGIVSGIVIAQITITFHELSDIKPLESYSTYAIPTKVYDRNGKLIAEFYREKREIISYKDMPQTLIQAIVAIEDNKFFEHKGFNLFAMIRGALIDPLLGKRARGGSTITQQLAKRLYTSGERSIFRKIVELWYAMQIEKKYSKEEILEMYFNEVYLGHGCYGVETASQFYFGKHAKDLSLAESAMLAGMVQMPEGYSLLLRPEQARKRHRQVLNAMVEMKFITKSQADEAYEDFWNNLHLYVKADSVIVQRSSGAYAPYFVEYVRQILEDRFGKENLYTAGYSVYTTLDLDKQILAEKYVKAAVSNEQFIYDAYNQSMRRALQENYADIVDALGLYLGLPQVYVGFAKIQDSLDAALRDYEDVLYLVSYGLGAEQVNLLLRDRLNPNRIQTARQDQVEGALVSIEPSTGYIEAMVGGKDFSSYNQFNRAVQARRQMGSLFKPVYYAVAIEKKIITPASVFDDAPKVFQDGAGNPWIPRNYEGTFRGEIRVRTALQYSVNLVAIQIWQKLMQTVGYEATANMIAGLLGTTVNDVRKNVQPSLAFALGVGTFTPIQVAQGFATIANNGEWVRPLAIRQVKDRYGRVVADFEMERDLNKSNRQQILSEGAAYIMQDMLSTVLYHGTGAGAATAAGFNYPAGGKTGTTPNWKDAWFAGFTKNLATVVWVGFDDYRKALGRHRAAAVVAAPIWMNYMRDVSQKNPPLGFSQPSDVVRVGVCADTGLLPTPYCPDVIGELFLRTTVPSRTCDKHTSEASVQQQEEIHLLTNQVPSNFNFDNGGNWNLDGNPNTLNLDKGL